MIGTTVITLNAASLRAALTGYLDGMMIQGVEIETISPPPGEAGLQISGDTAIDTPAVAIAFRPRPLTLPPADLPRDLVADIRAAMTATPPAIAAPAGDAEADDGDGAIRAACGLVKRVPPQSGRFPDWFFREFVFTGGDDWMSVAEICEIFVACPAPMAHGRPSLGPRDVVALLLGVDGVARRDRIEVIGGNSIAVPGLTGLIRANHAEPSTPEMAAVVEAIRGGDHD